MSRTEISPVIFRAPAGGLHLTRDYRGPSPSPSRCDRFRRLSRAGEHHPARARRPSLDYPHLPPSSGRPSFGGRSSIDRNEAAPALAYHSHLSAPSTPRTVSFMPANSRPRVLCVARSARDRLAVGERSSCAAGSPSRFRRHLFSTPVADSRKLAPAEVVGRAPLPSRTARAPRAPQEHLECRRRPTNPGGTAIPAGQLADGRLAATSAVGDADVGQPRDGGHKSSPSRLGEGATRGWWRGRRAAAWAAAPLRQRLRRLPLPDTSSGRIVLRPQPSRVFNRLV